MADDIKQAGLELQLKNFDGYIAGLKRIEKQTQETFGANFKAAKAQQQGFDQQQRQLQQSTRAQERELQQQLKALQRTEAEKLKAYEASAKAQARIEKQRQREAERTAAAQQIANKQFIGQVIGVATAAIAGGFELSKQSAQFEAQSAGLRNLAGSYGQASGEILQAMQRASNGVLSSSDAILAANKALLLGVARTPEEFERVTSSALILGRAMGLTATESIDQFTTALGRRSVQILDNFGLSGDQVTATMERMARVQFGKAVDDLSEAQKNALFMAAALQEAETAAAAIGTEVGKASESFERLEANAANVKLAVGAAFQPQFTAAANRLNDAVTALGQSSALAGAGLTTLGDLAKQFDNNIGQAMDGTRAWGDVFDLNVTQAVDRGNEVFKNAARAMGVQFPEDLAKGTAAEKQLGAAVEDTSEALKRQQRQVEQQQRIIRQAEGIALSYARSLEDANRNLQRSEQRLQEQQAKARDKALKSQQAQLDEFEAEAVKDRGKATAEATKKEAEIRQKAGQQQADDQRKLFLDLKQQQQRFDLDRLQSRRRFELSDRRLRAEGDILGLQSLREDYELQQTENKENFDLQKRQTKDGAAEQRQQQARDNEEQIAELRRGLAEQNAEFEAGINERRQQLLTSFDEEFLALQESQQEQRDELQRGYQQQLEDMNLNRDRQIEDLGRSFVEMEGVTQEGAQKLADQLEKAFGIEGTADQIMSGFAERQAGKFQGLFEFIGTGLRNLTPRTASDVAGTAPSRTGRLSFADGGIVPGPMGAPVPALLHAGEMVLNQGQQQQVMTMLAPVVTSQSSRHQIALSGGFHVTGSGSVSDAQIADISNRVNREVIENVQTALTRVKRRG